MTNLPDLNPAPGWAKVSGHAILVPLTNGVPGENGVDRFLIAERIFRYGWAYDERDRELLGDCFTSNGIWEGDIMGTTAVGPFVGREAIVEFLTGFWSDQTDQRRHIFTNIVIDGLTSHEATAHAYLLLTASSDSMMTPVTTGPYRFELVKGDDSWRLQRLVGGFDAPF